MPTPENQSYRLLDSHVVAASLGIHRKTLQRFARERRIASVRIGKHLKFRPADIETFIVANQLTAGRTPKVTA